MMCGCTLVAACHRGPPGLEVLTPVLSTARVYYDDGPAFRDSVRMVVRDGAAWRTVWAQATSTQPAPPPLPDELEQLLRRMRLPYIRKAAPEVIANATAQRWEHAEVLRVLLSEEVKGREQATIRNRRRASGLPAVSNRSERGGAAVAAAALNALLYAEVE